MHDSRTGIKPWLTLQFRAGKSDTSGALIYGDRRFMIINVALVSLVVLEQQPWAYIIRPLKSAKLSQAAVRLLRRHK
jgi:hypothetical protein